MKQNTYLEAKVLTATSHQLHLMLAEGAIRIGRQAEQAMRRGDFAAAAPMLLRMIDIVGEMLAGVRSSKTELNRKIAGLYLFLVRKIADAKISDNVGSLAAALELLEYERQTWQLVCDKDKSGAATPPKTPEPAAAGRPRPKAPITPPLGLKTQSTHAPGISLEA